VARIAAAALIAVGAAVTLTWAVLKNEIGDAVVAFASEQAELFARTAGRDLVAGKQVDRAALQRALAGFAAVQPRRRLGNPVAIELVDLEGRRLAFWQRSDDPGHVGALEILQR